MLTGFPRTRWPRRRFSELCGTNFRENIANLLYIYVIMGIMTGLLGCCSASTLGSRVNDYVVRPAPRADPGFQVRGGTNGGVLGHTYKYHRQYIYLNYDIIQIQFLLFKKSYLKNF